MDRINAQLTEPQKRSALAYSRGLDIKALPNAPAVITIEDVARILETSRVFEDSHAIADEASILGETILGYLRFIGIVTSREQDLFKGLKRTFPQVKLFVHQMMDMERTYGQQPDFHFHDQVTKMLALQRQFPGEILTFAAFDPFRREAALTSAIDAYRKGAIGFKFYPPAGYSPALNKFPLLEMEGTDQRQYNSRYAGILATNLDYWNRQFFQFCASNDIPIFVHCTTHGFEAVPGYGKLFNDPESWEPILAEFPKLRLCFGHAGGSDLWFSESSSQSAKFGRSIIELCSRYDSVYADAGYWQTVLEPGGPERLRARLLQLFAAHPELKRKLLYGTDWFMMSKEEDYRRYLCNMVQATDGLDFQADFFAGNVARYLNLASLADTDQQGARLTPKVTQGIQRIQKRIRHEQAKRR